MSPLLPALFALLLLPALPLMPAAAADTDEHWYQIELVIFEYTGSDKTTEVWSENPGEPDMDGAAELHKPQAPADRATADNGTAAATSPSGATAAEPYTLLPEDELALNDDIKRLNDSADYQPLIHIGWRQPAPERGRGRPVLIDSRKLPLYTAQIADTPADTAGAESGDALSPPDLYEQGPDEIVTTINENFVTGTVTLTRGRYLHMGLDLLYEHQPNSPQLFSFFGFGNTGDIPEDYRLTQQRRVRRGELHYFDHPKFGVLAIVTAVDEDAEADEGAQTIPLKRLH
jgi:hypothetical protein